MNSSTGQCSAHYPRWHHLCGCPCCDAAASAARDFFLSLFFNDGRTKGCCTRPIATRQIVACIRLTGVLVVTRRPALLVTPSCHRSRPHSRLLRQGSSHFLCSCHPACICPAGVPAVMLQLVLLVIPSCHQWLLHSRQLRQGSSRSVAQRDTLGQETHTLATTLAQVRFYSV
jgi:hypothetical protein